MTKPTLQTWHYRLGHVCERTTRKLLANNGLSASNEFSICKSCILSKHHRLPYNSRYLQSKLPLDLLYTDVWGPAPCLSITGDRYYLLIVDDCTKFN